MIFLRMSRYACPICNINTGSQRLKHGKKFCYVRHRCLLNHSHKYRNDAESFDGTKELGLAPGVLTGSMVFNQLEDIKFSLGKANEEISGVIKNTWKKKSIFFKLPYWEVNLLRHNLDVIHIEKNVCDNLVDTLLNIERKSKDNFNARRDLKEIR